MVAKAKQVALVHADAVRRAAEAGVRIAMGTDSGVGPHGKNLQELALMGAAGLTPAAALHAATGSAAELCGLGDVVGTIRPGLVADLVVVGGDPFELAGLPDRVEQVWQGGIRVDTGIGFQELTHV